MGNCAAYALGTYLLGGSPREVREAFTGRKHTCQTCGHELPAKWVSRPSGLCFLCRPLTEKERRMLDES